MMKKDKIYHLTAGAIASAVTFCAAKHFITSGYAALAGIVAAIIAGIAKEYWDSRGHGTVDVWDAVATAVGGCIVASFGSLF